MGTIEGIEVNHGAASDGRNYFVTNEADSMLEVVDGKSLKIIKRIKLTGHPNNLSAAPDGSKVYVAIRDTPGALDIIDTKKQERTNSIPMTELHNTQVTPDGKFVLAGSIAGKSITIVDAKTEQVVGKIEFDRGVRPVEIETNPDGSTSRLFVQLSDYNGFAVVDWAQKKEVARMPFPEIPEKDRITEGLQNSPAHGIAISPDKKTLWQNSKMNGRVYVMSLPDLKIVGEVKVGSHPDWMTFSPDGKYLYVANAGSNTVSVIDAAARKEIKQIPVGEVPKRNYTAVLQ